jgi:hypothetical protein
MFWWESSKERDQSEDRDVDERMGSEWMLGTLAGGVGVKSVVSGWGQVAVSCELGDKPSGSGATELVSYFNRMALLLDLPLEKLLWLGSVVW